MDAVLNWLWQGGVVALASWLMLRALERARANVRYVVCWAAALFVIVLPALPELPSAAVSHTSQSAAPIDAVLSLPDAWWTSTVLIVVAWTVWAGVQIVRFVSAIVAIRRARARCRAFPADVESGLLHWCRVRSEGRRAQLVLSESVTAAAVLGWGTAIIAVSPSLVTLLDADELDRVLIHEWTHVQRRDDLANVLQIVIRTVAGWHPALWWIDRRLHVEREIACDEMTVRLTGSPKSYAACLMKLASVTAAGELETASAVFTRSGLRGRVLKIVSRRAPIAPIWSRAVAATMIAALCLVSVAVGSMTLVEAAELSAPFLSSRTLIAPIAPLSAAPVTRWASHEETAHASRRTPQQPPAPSSQSEPRPSAPPELPLSEVAERTKPFDTTELPSPPEAGPQLPPAPAPNPATPSAAIAPPQPPWAAAASNGTAIGRKSKDAGVATAGFFTRAAHRIAGRF